MYLFLPESTKQQVPITNFLQIADVRLNQNQKLDYEHKGKMNIMNNNIFGCEPSVLAAPTKAISSTPYHF